MSDRVDHRVLAAVRFVDCASRAPITRALRVEVDGAKLVRNLSGAWVITLLEGPLAGVSDVFDAQRLPQGVALASESVTLSVVDPLGEYLPRATTIRLPRDADPTHRNQPDSLFQAQRVSLYPSPAARAVGNTAVLRVSVTRVVDGAKVEVRGAVVRVVHRDDPNRELGLGVSNARGETLVLIPALPLTTFASTLGDDDDANAGGAAPVTTPDTPARAQVFFDPQASWPLDPERIAAVAANRRASFDFSIQAGRVLTRSVELP